ncbi:transposase [Photobacterium damselae subsp. damselae]|uniref:RNA-guided endonuclease InsQ/TnpB family protein n=1 Tax=Photobacterium damselae TaxID=38293 RepID=UPI000A2FDBDE|nr:RNA-guided endonuclease TnpB family protein [Photobacterium damselae]ARR50003.1 transposase [Photobacterium damselae subsp. damselae]ARR51107.1 transposase [Photobacterium damselae subsp. damselae]QAY35452.1 transposase [Photobacterium damselae subsp. damselae]QAY37108.1 transposase [Photobacterium damselae subsp. damselae]QOQ67631.1 transposase [Photobacterium damselae subsp. damselae]
MKRAYKERFYPNEQQAELLAKSFGCCRFVWNNSLKYRTDAYYERGESIAHSVLEKRLVPLKAEFEWLKEVSSVIFQQALRDQQEAFKNFWDKRAKYPKFKSKHDKQSIRLTKAAFKYKDGLLFIAKSKQPLDIRWSRKLLSEPSSITISKDKAGRYFVSMLCEFESKPMPITVKTVGIDLGLNNLFITDSGEKVDNPRHTKRYENKLAYLQRQLAKKKKGSKNRDKIRQKVARLHAKIADSRLDNLHKLSRKLINENQVVCVESLAVKNMIRNPKLSKHIADASWGEFVRQLKYKAEWAGRTIAEIDQFFPSSKRCSCCGFVHESMPLNIRNWSCPECNTYHDRDINAAMNIKTVGLAGLV